MPEPFLAPLTITRLVFNADMPCYAETFAAHAEQLLYALIGRLRVYADGRFLGSFGGRHSVKQPQAHVIRFPAGVYTSITILLDTPSADCLLVEVGAPENHVTKLPYTHRNESAYHIVGEGTHRRTVLDVPTPYGFVLAAGETFQEAGTTSSWPPHASQDDLRLYEEGKTTWQEQMYFCCADPATATLVGLYPGGRKVSELRSVQNGTTLAMPLGSHPIHSAATSWTWYAWFYCGNALQKRYNATSCDVGTYRQ